MARKVDRFCPFCGAMTAHADGGGESGNGWYRDGSGPETRIRVQNTMCVSCTHDAADCGEVIGAKLVELDPTSVEPLVIRDLYEAHAQRTGKPEMFAPEPSDVMLCYDLLSDVGKSDSVSLEDFNAGKLSKCGKPLKPKMRKKLTHPYYFYVYCACGCGAQTENVIFYASEWIHEFVDHGDYWNELDSKVDPALLEYPAAIRVRESMARTEEMIRAMRSGGEL